jgi:hypothetical protein
MGEKKEIKEVMRPFFIQGARSTKGKIIFVLAVISVLLGLAPFIMLINSVQIIFGLPALLIWGFFLMALAIGITSLAIKWGVK